MIVHQKPRHLMSRRAKLAICLAALIVLPVAAQTKKEPKSDPTQPATKAADVSIEPTDPTPLPAESQSQRADPVNPTDATPAEVTSSNANPKNQNEARLTEAEATAVERNSVKFIARLTASKDLHLSSLHSGVLQEFLVTDGEKVKRGQILARIKNTNVTFQLEEARGALSVQQKNVETAQAAVQLAESSWRSAKGNHSRAAQLNKRGAGVIPKSQVDEFDQLLQEAELTLEKSRRELSAAQAEEELMKKRADRAAQLVEELNIAAPADGILVNTFTQAGEVVKPNDVIFQIVDISSLTAETQVYNGRRFMGKTVHVSIDAGDGKKAILPAKVTFASPLVDPVSQKFPIRCTFKNSGPRGEPLTFPGRDAIVLIPRLLEALD